MSKKRGSDQVAGPVPESQSKRVSVSGPDEEERPEPEMCFWVYRDHEPYWPALAAFGYAEFEKVQRIKKANVTASVERSSYDTAKLCSSNIVIMWRGRDDPVSFKTSMKHLKRASDISGQTDWIGMWEDEIEARKDEKNEKQ